jgi:hypothetical protein
MNFRVNEALLKIHRWIAFNRNQSAVLIPEGKIPVSTPVSFSSQHQ